MLSTLVKVMLVVATFIITILAIIALMQMLFSNKRKNGSAIIVDARDPLKFAGFSEHGVLSDGQNGHITIIKRTNEIFLCYNNGKSWIKIGTCDNPDIWNHLL